MATDRAYPKLQFVHVLASVAAACLFVAIGWTCIKVLPAMRVQAHAQRVSDLFAVGVAYRDFQLENDGRSPSSEKEMAPYLRDDHPSALQRLSDGEYTVAWNAKLHQQLPFSELLLGQELARLDGEFLVLFADAHVATLTPDELRESPWVETND